MIVPYNTLLYLALIRPVFCIGAIINPNWNKVYKKKSMGSRMRRLIKKQQNNKIWMSKSSKKNKMVNNTREHLTATGTYQI